jgi:hypothetical protein
MYFLVELNPFVTPFGLVALPLLSPLTSEFTLDCGLQSLLVSSCNHTVLFLIFLFFFVLRIPCLVTILDDSNSVRKVQHSNHIKKLSSLVLGYPHDYGRSSIDVEEGDVSILCRLMLYISVLMLFLSADWQEWEITIKQCC